MPGSNGNSTYPIVGFGANASDVGSSSQSVPSSGTKSVSVKGLAGVVTNLFNGILQSRENRLNREFAAQQAQLQNQWNIEQWNRENAYDSPAAQMARYKAAGLNPNLVLDQPNLAASSPQLVSAKDAPAGIAPRIDPLVSAQIRNLDAQSQNLETQSHLNETQVKSLLGDTPLSDAEIRHMNQLTANLVQQYNTNRFEELVASGAVEYSQTKHKYSVSGIGPDGEETTYYYDIAPIESAIADYCSFFNAPKEVQSAMANYYVASSILPPYQAAVLDAQEKELLSLAGKYGLEGQQIAAFLKYAADYYKGLSDEQSAMGVLQQINARFFQDHPNLAPAMLNAVTGLGSSMISTLGKFIPKFSKIIK